MDRDLKFSFKETIWCEVSVPKELQEAVFKEIKNGKIKSADAIFEKFNHDLLSYDILDDTAVQMSVEQNNGFATIEIEDHTGKFVFLNGLDS